MSVKKKSESKKKAHAWPHAKVLEGSFNPKAAWSEVYDFWEGNGCFESADTSQKGQKAYCIMIPPPNVTGVLHMGHALTNTIQDVLVRWRRMKGDNTLWLPGTDHAGIATQAVVERELKKEKNAQGRPVLRQDLGRDAFIQRVWEWKEEHGNLIAHQQRRLGNSLDWSRERFTMDPGFSSAVREVFVRLYEEGLIYRGERIINWCTVSQTALSDLEVIPKETKGSLWHIRYLLTNAEGEVIKKDDGTDASIIVATTRPETLLGDTAVAVHPEDERYKSFHGMFAQLPLLGRLIPIIQDAHVDQTFGSGAVKVTPAHDFDDYEIGQRHKLPMILLINKEGKLSAAAGPYAGLKVMDARNRVVSDLKDKGALVKTEDHLHKVGYSQRSDQIAEPMVSKQWFVKIKPLAEPAIQAVRSGEIEFTPKSWEKTYFEWMENIRDWCISRQLWWGHQIPAWHCQQCAEITVSRETPVGCSNCGAKAADLKQDEDVLDTWFSSALWPFATLGWPEKTPALKTFYPNSVLETGFDIIFFWVARMIMMGIHFTGEVPFRKVYLHAMVRDENGEKMSKSKGNVIDPLDLIDACGADSLRFTLAVFAGQGRDIKLAPARVEGYQAFCNKLWNASKFFHFYMQQDGMKKVSAPKEGVADWIKLNRNHLNVTNRWILSLLQDLMETVDKGFDQFALNVSAQALYDFTWHEFCDWYVEFSKLALREDDDFRKETLYVLHFVLEEVLKLLHPIVPFITEEIWQSLPWKYVDPDQVESLMLQRFPLAQKIFKDSEAERTMASLKSMIDALRNFRGENGLSPKKEFSVYYTSQNSATDAFVKLHAQEITTLARVQALIRLNDHVIEGPVAVLPIANPPMELHIALRGLVDVDEESKRLKKEIERIHGDLTVIRKKLSNDAFVAKAPTELVAKEQTRERDLVSKLGELEGALTRLSQLSG